MSTDDDEQEVFQKWYDRKSAYMVQSLGREHDMVMHAIIPFSVGGGLDFYYYPHGLPGTAIATKELCEVPNEGSRNDVYRNYELVMFSKQSLDLDVAQDESTPFGRVHHSMCAILNCIASYSERATLNPGETCEFPADMDNVGGKCLVFDSFACHEDEEYDNFGLLVLIEVFRSEMEFARQHGSQALFSRLKSKGFYPYSDLDRQPVA